VGTPEVKNPEGGWAWVAFYNSAEGMRAQGGPPEDGPFTRKSLAEWFKTQRAPSWWDPRGVNAMHDVTAPAAKGPSQHVNFARLMADVNAAFQPIWKGEKSAKVAMSEAIAALNAVAAQDTPL
jgi:ABC-type glycerol-3-phosphate transport system substrate-binding protein